MTQYKNGWWIMHGIASIHQQSWLKRNKHSKDRDSHLLRFCEDCRTVWEFDSHNRFHYYYSELTGLGIQRDKCPRCETRPTSLSDTLRGGNY